ncbi:MAG TPA: hypothetical protein VFI31_19095 [Pirellulales bacterium]|nr:hypothetical protein [Pirellulales bacterium]
MGLIISFAHKLHPLYPDAFTLAAYCSGDVPEAYVAHLAAGEEIPPLPLFLTAASYVDVPFAAAYDAAWRGVPTYWQRVLAGA